MRWWLDKNYIEVHNAWRTHLQRNLWTSESKQCWLIVIRSQPKHSTEQWGNVGGVNISKIAWNTYPGNHYLPTPVFSGSILQIPMIALQCLCSTISCSSGETAVGFRNTIISMLSMLKTLEQPSLRDLAVKQIKRFKNAQNMQISGLIPAYRSGQASEVPQVPRYSYSYHFLGHNQSLWPSNVSVPYMELTKSLTVQTFRTFRVIPSTTWTSF